jgi:hypothetical protein
MALSVALLRMQMKQDIRNKRTSLIKNYVANYAGTPPAAELKALDAQLDRIKGSLPRGDFCPHCYFLDGSQKTLLITETVKTEKLVQSSCPGCGFSDWRPK